MRILCLMVVTTLASVATAGISPEPIDIDFRGDSNDDGAVNGSDVAHLSAYLYQGGAEPPCLNAADVNDDGSLNTADISYLTSWLYQGGPAPPSPFGSTCATDSTEPNLSCDSGC